MLNDKYLYLMQLCMELQREEDGRIERRRAKGRCGIDDKVGPTAFFSFLGHVAQLEIGVNPRGWDNEEDYRFFAFDLDLEIDQKEFGECRDLLLSLLKKEGV